MVAVYFLYWCTYIVTITVPQFSVINSIVFIIISIHKRINFKVATITYKVLSTQQPTITLYHTTKPVPPAGSNDINRLWTSCFLLCCSLNQESYTYCYQRLGITWLLQTSPQNSLLSLTITLINWQLSCTPDLIFLTLVHYPVFYITLYHINNSANTRFSATKRR